MPLASIQLTQALVPQNFELLVGLFQLGVHVAFIELVALGDGVLLIRLMPLSVPADGIELTSVALIVPLVVLAGPALHDRVLGVAEVLASWLHFSTTYFRNLLKIKIN